MWQVLIHPARSITLPGPETMLSSVFCSPGDALLSLGSSQRFQVSFHVTFSSACQGVPERHKQGFGQLGLPRFWCWRGDGTEWFPRFLGRLARILVECIIKRTGPTLTIKGQPIWLPISASSHMWVCLWVCTSVSSLVSSFAGFYNNGAFLWV